MAVMILHLDACRALVRMQVQEYNGMMVIR